VSDRRALAPPPYQRHQVLGALGVAAVAVAVSLVKGDSLTIGILSQWATYALAGVGFYIVFGLSGQFAFSQAAFMGLGAYTTAWASDHVGFVGGFVAAIVVSTVVALAFSWIVRRTEAFYFAIATLALSFIFLVVFREWEAFTAPGGEVGGIPRPDLFGWDITGDRGVFWLTLAVLTIGLALTGLVERSPLRRAAIALRDKPEVAAAAGLPTGWTRYCFFAVGSAFAAAAGALSAHRIGFINPDSFSLQLGIDLFLVLLLGGIGSMWGAVIGAAFVVWAPEQLRFVGAHQALIYGVLLVVVVLALPRGLVGLYDLLPWRRRRHRDDVTTLEVPPEEPLEQGHPGVPDGRA
jgi:branched-chain amino acid transport system permease protein